MITEEPSDLLELASRMVAQIQRRASSQWSAQQWNAHTATALNLLQTDNSPRRLGEFLRRDETLDLPFTLVKACYERLFQLGVNDARTRLCYARYLLMHGPDWDEEAQEILAEVEGPARAAGLWASSWLGHHPVFFVGS